jgi:thiol-disulfide isomerase/thioredoxin
MIRKLLVVTGAIVLALGGTIAILYISNAAPVVPTVSAAEASASTKPYVVKLHAQWCPYCMLTKDEWARVEQAYAGRLNFVVFDFTNAAATARSRAQATRLGLLPFFDDYNGATGLVAVLDGRTKDVLAEVGGNAPFEEFRSAIDAALATN